MTDTDRNSILDAIYVLNDIFDYLVAGTMVFDRYQMKYESGEFSQPGIVAVQKMCVSHLILGLSKLVEFWEYYHHLVPDELRPEVKATVSKLRSRDLKHFRNTVVAHIWDKKLKRTRSQFEAIDQLNRISDDNPKAFLSWLNNPSGNVYPKNLVSIVETLRDRLREEHNISAEEVFNR
ncbi:MAG: hypothetical protein L3J28_07685 [Candidatus Polarisedimenticolaceae bacterium]|nr:hypothetical protein [Candidatus Polarisedimenticolaceae bacterium]